MERERRDIDTGAGADLLQGRINHSHSSLAGASMSCCPVHCRRLTSLPTLEALKPSEAGDEWWHLRQQALDRVQHPSRTGDKEEVADT